MTISGVAAAVDVSSDVDEDDSLAFASVVDQSSVPVVDSVLAAPDDDSPEAALASSASSARNLVVSSTAVLGVFEAS